MMRLFSRTPVAATAARCYVEQQYSNKRPTFEFSLVDDEPSKGFTLRAVVDEKRVLLTYVPQLGPRKSDPNDPAPQFDFAARRSIRLFQHEVAGLLTVCEGKVTQHQIQSHVHDLSFSGAENNGYIFQGTLSKKSSPTPWTVHFDGYKATMFRHFLNSALNDSFGFHKHFQAVAKREAYQSERQANYASGRQDGNGNNNNNGNGGNNGNNNNNSNGGNQNNNNNNRRYNNGNNNNNNRRQYSN